MRGRINTRAYVMCLWNETEMRRKEKEDRKKLMENPKSDVDSEEKKGKRKLLNLEQLLITLRTMKGLLYLLNLKVFMNQLMNLLRKMSGPLVNKRLSMKMLGVLIYKMMLHKKI